MPLICFDLDRLDSDFRQSLLSGKLEVSGAIWIDKDRVDETAVAFKCSLSVAALTCDILLSYNRKVGDIPTRVYIQRSPRLAWERLPAEAVLTYLEDGKVCLSPGVFPPKEGQLARPEFGPAILGGRK